MTMRAYHTLDQSLSHDGRVLTITMNRPEQLNAVDDEMHRELARVFMDAGETDCDLIVFTGRGKAFSAGGDLDWQMDGIRHPKRFERTVREAKQIVYSILDCDLPIIAKVNGPAVGLGATMALFCDTIFVSEESYISDPHVNIGMVAGDGGAVIWPQLIGFAKAKEYLFTGKKIPAKEAERIGLINHAVPADRLNAEVNAYLEVLLAQPQRALRWTKVSTNIPLKALVSNGMDASLAYESFSNILQDHEEAIDAFRERRPGNFGRGHVSGTATDDEV